MEENLTPLEMARQKQNLLACVNCKNCVEVRGAYFCEKSGKLLIPRFMEIGCMHKPSQFEKKEYPDDNG